jgi:hypothetical protein
MLMNFSFDWSIVPSGAPYVTISRYGIAFNSIAISKLGTPSRIIIGFDEEKLALGVKKYEGEENAKPYEFARRVKDGWIRIGCAEFIKYLQKISNLDFTSKAIKYTPIFDERDNTMVVELMK